VNVELVVIPTSNICTPDKKKKFEMELTGQAGPRFRQSRMTRTSSLASHRHVRDRPAVLRSPASASNVEVARVGNRHDGTKTAWSAGRCGRTDASRRDDALTCNFGAILAHHLDVWWSVTTRTPLNLRKAADAKWTPRR